MGEVADEVDVCGQEVIFWQAGEGGPEHRVEDAILKLAVKMVNDVELQVDCSAIAVTVADVGDLSADGSIYAKFFIQLTGKCLL